MKLERLHEYILSTVVILCAMLFAGFAGKMIGSGQLNYVFMALAGIPLILVSIKLESKIWLAIPLGAGFSGIISGFPLGLPLKDLIFFYVFLSFLVMKALKIVRTKPTIDLLDVILTLNVVYLTFVFIRNPVGALGLETERIGGRPYFDVGATYCAYWVLSRVILSPRMAYKLPALMVVSQVFEGFAGFIADKLPRIAAPLGQVYTSFAPQTSVDANTPIAETEIARFGYLSGPGGSISKTLGTYFNPSTLFNPLFFWRFVAFIFSVICIFLSGFRSVFVEMIAILLLMGYLRGGRRQILRLGMVVLPAVALLILGQGRIFNLPRSAQRALSFLPGRWDPDALEDADASTEWRLEMWKDALDTNIYIENKLFGDGFGVNRRVWEEVQFGMSARIEQRLKAEDQAIMGQFHSGPISTIRIVGYIGLGLYYLLILMLVRKAWTLVNRAKNTPFFPMALLFCVPTIWYPIFFTFIFGSYDGGFADSIFNLGMLKTLEASLFEYQKHPDSNLPTPPLDQAPDGSLPRKLERWTPAHSM